MLLVLLAVASALAAPIVNTSFGTLQGVEIPRGEKFLGVPFARAPTGSLRWQPPLPPYAWRGVREATEYGPDCISGPDDYVLYPQSEDCLFLNVYRPNNISTQDKLPVMHFLYGGSWQYGGSSFFIYNGDNIVQFADVIVVVSNYRLGSLGFLGSAELARLTADRSTGNYGLQDQRAAMVWIQDNIAAFGGDPDRVMLFGESAGSGSVANHLILPRSANLFNVAAMESGPPADWSAIPMNLSQAHFDFVAEKMNCNGTADVVECLRGKTAKEFAAINAVDFLANSVLNWFPVIDGVELTAEPQHLWEQGKLNKVEAILIGTNKDEGSEFIKVPHDLSPDNYTVYLTNRFGAAFGAQVEAMYPPANYGGAYWAVDAIFTDSMMACPSRRAARWATAVNTPAFLYEFVHELEALKLADPWLGVPHASEVPMVYYATELLWTDAEKTLSKYFISYWTSFATFGNPNHGYLQAPSWPVFDPSNGAYMRLDLIPSNSTNLRTSVCDFWDKVYSLGCVMDRCPCYCNL